MRSCSCYDRESEQLRQQLVQATSELQAVQQEASEAQAAARERQKRFTMLNATFRRKEEALVGRAEEAEGALSQARTESEEAKHLAAQAEKVRTHNATLDMLRSSGQSAVHTAERCAGCRMA